ncbi:MAG: tyrosine-type recombinase/integrase [Clostridia bacterium]|nr:tyrosine-type recombinase/integrase [Clostridia bacterium]
MSTPKELRIHNKSSKPDNVVAKENDLVTQCMAVEKALPRFMTDFFYYLKNSVAISTRQAYLSDILFFCNYLIKETVLTEAEQPRDISLEEFNNIKARDINRFLGDYCTRYVVETKNLRSVMENHNRSLARKKSSLAILFKFLYRDESLENNIVDGINPIKLPKPQPDAIKRLQIDEVSVMLDAVSTGSGLTEKEKQYWEKTKYRDKAILVIFVTYGLRLSELQQLNLTSFHFARGEFTIYRKRGKESVMPLNKSVIQVIDDYIQYERNYIKDKVTSEDEDALFISLQGSRMTVKAIRKLVKKYTSIPLGTAREKGYSPHKLRATAASSLIEYGFSIYEVQNLLDHDNVTTTQLYSAHRKHAKREIVKSYELLDDDKDKDE